MHPLPVGPTHRTSSHQPVVFQSTWDAWFAGGRPFSRRTPPGRVCILRPPNRLGTKCQRSIDQSCMYLHYSSQVNPWSERDGRVPCRGYSSTADVRPLLSLCLHTARAHCPAPGQTDGTFHGICTRDYSSLIPVYLISFVLTSYIMQQREGLVFFPYM